VIGSAGISVRQPDGLLRSVDSLLRPM